MLRTLEHHTFRRLGRRLVAPARACLFWGLVAAAALALSSGFGSAAESRKAGARGKAHLSVSQSGFARDGNLVVRLSDGTIRKYSPGGSVLWEMPLMAPREGAPVNPYSIDFDGPDIVMVGLSLEASPQVALYRLEGDAPEVKKVRTLPAWIPGGITVAPDGTLFLVALSARKVNGVQAAKAPGMTVTDYSIHQLDRNGNLLQSLAAVTYSTDSASEMAKKMAGAKVIFSPSGKAFLFVESEPVLRQLNLDTGELEGYVPLPFSGFSEMVVVPSLDFVSDSEVLYSLFQAKDNRVLGSQIRLLNLDTGESELLSSTGPDRMMDFGQYDPVSRSIQAFSLRFDEPFGQSTFQLRQVSRPFGGRNQR